MTEIIDYSIIQNDLHPDETLIWAGKPKRGIIFTSDDIFIIPFSIFFEGIILFFGYIEFWITNSMINNIGTFISWLILFSFGLFAIFGRFIDNAIYRKYSIYCLTSKRVIIITNIFHIKLTSHYWETISNIKYFKNKDGSGSIFFRRVNLEQSFFPSALEMRIAPNFRMINEVEQVLYNIIKLLDSNKIIYSCN